MKWFTSDWHLGHDNVMKFSRRPFSNISEMNERIVSNVLSVLRPGDDLYFLGDLAWRRFNLDGFFDRWPRNVNFHWILGNHDKNWTPFKSKCASISDMGKTSIDGNTVILCHYPMLTWNRSHYDSWMLFGHHHENSHGTAELASKATGKMLNVNVEFNNFLPYSEKEVAAFMEKRPRNWDFISRT